MRRFGREVCFRMALINLTVIVPFDVFIVGQPGLFEGLTFILLVTIAMLLIAIYLKGDE